MITRLILLIEQLIDFSGRAISWLTLFMVITTFTVVVLRYAFDFGQIGLQESISYMHACIFLVGAAYTLKQNSHVRVDIIYQKLSHKQKAWVDLLGTIFLLAPSMIFIFWVSWEYVSESWNVHESSREAGGLPGVYILKSVILLMAAMMLMQGLATTLRCIQTIDGRLDMVNDKNREDG